MSGCCSDTYSGKDLKIIAALIDSFGVSSAAAQGVPQPMTCAAKLRASGHRIYVYSDGTRAKGFLKVGTKHLYIYDRKGQVTEMDPVCALDFYVCEDCQRQGLGQALLSYFLEAESLEARKVAWDKPTDKSLGLLSKLHSLSSFNPQPNNFVVFDEYYD